MAIDKQEIEKYFSIGDVVSTGGGRSSFEIAKIDNRLVRIKVISSGNFHRVNYQKISALIDDLSKINKNSISVDDVLHKAGLGAGNKIYAHGLAREYLKRKELHLLSSSHVQNEFESAVEKSKQSNSAERQKRLKNTLKKPEKITTTSVTFKRNPDVVAEVLERADGICEECKKPAPFNRKKDNTPYLEVHHIIRLADDGDDSVENAIALCPNCHREAHFG